MQLIYYSVALTPDGKYGRQWIQSIRSLRARNPTIPVCLFVFNGISAEVAREADRQRVDVVLLGDYREWMARRSHPHGALLAFYPTLHNLLVVAEKSMEGVSQALYVDCDTFFFKDPRLLFDLCTEGDWYAREMPGSRLSPHGRTGNLDEDLVAQLANHEGLRVGAPFNTGVCLLNKKAWTTLARLEHFFLDYVWRLMVGMHRQEAVVAGKERRTPTLRAATSNDVQRMRTLVLSAASTADLDRALPYPSDNWWVLNEIAWMFAVGRSNGLAQRQFTTAHVAQGDEFSRAIHDGTAPVMAHYFSHFETDFFRCIAPI